MVEVQRRGTAAEGASFRLERFEWAAPDRLELAGRFDGVDPPTAGTSLVIRGADGDARLEGRVVSASADGRPWSAAFLWRDAPIAFDTAGLELGEGRVVTLPAPGGAVEPGQRLEIHIADPPRPSAGIAARPMADALRLQATLVAAQDEARHAEAARERLEEELARARQDLESDRARHAADAERFRAGLATVQEAGEQALAETLEDNVRLRDRLTDLEGGLEDVTALRAGFEQAGEANAALRAELEQAGEANAALRAELEQARTDAAQGRAELEQARTEATRLEADLEQARVGATQLRAELEQARTDAAQVLAELEQAEAARAEAERAGDEAAQLRAELDRVAGEGAALRLELEQLGAEHARAHAEIERLGTDAAALRDELEHARGARDDAERLRARLAAVRAAIGQED